MICLYRLATLLCAVALLAGNLRAQDEQFEIQDQPTAEDAQKTIDAQGLKKAGSVLVIAGEDEIEAKMKDAMKIKTSKIIPAQKALKQAEQGVDALKAQFEKGKKYLDKLDIDIAGAGTVSKHNQLVLEYRKAQKQLESIDEQVDKAEKVAKEKRAAAMQAAEDFSEQLLQIRKLYDKTERQYKSLGQMKDLAAAIDSLNGKDAKTKTKLGPSSAMVSTGSKLKNLEGTVFSESIPITKTEGDLWTASVVFGDAESSTYAVEMEIDTGASSVVLPHKIAKELGLEPGPDAPTVRGQLANGQIVQGKRVVAPRVRVGKFEVRDVECLVFGPEYPMASALLGQSFLSNFVYKIDAVSSKLVMTQLESPSNKARVNEDAEDKKDKDKE